MLAGMALGQGTAMAADDGCVVGQSTIPECFPDPLMAKAVNGWHNDVNRTFRESDTHIHELDIHDAYMNVDGQWKLVHVHSLKGMEHLTSITVLDIRDCSELTDISQVGDYIATKKKEREDGYKKYKDLFDHATNMNDKIKYHKIMLRERDGVDVTALYVNNSKKIRNLNVLRDMRVGAIIDYEDEGLTSLDGILPQPIASPFHYVWLDNNEISDLTPLKNMPHIARLYLQNNRISDITPLGSLKTLETLNVENNYITDLSPLQWGNLLGRELRAANQKASVPAKSSGVVSVPTARNADGSFVRPTRIRPSSGSYDPQTGAVTWNDLTGVERASFSFKSTLIAGCTGDCSVFAGDINVNVGGVPEAESLDPSPNSMLRTQPPSNPIVPPTRPKPQQPAPGVQLDPTPGIDPAPNPLSVTPTSLGPQQVATKAPVTEQMATTGAAITAIVLASFTVFTLGLCLALAKKRHGHTTEGR